MILASPMLVFNIVQPFVPFEKYPTLVLYDVCVENYDLELYRRVYSIAVIIVQYLLPVAIVSAAHARISRKLRNRMLTLQQRHMAETGGNSSSPQAGRTAPGGRQKPKANNQLPVSVAQMERRRLASKRKRKTNLLLVMIAVVFALSWLPLIVYNLIADLDMTLLRNFETKVSLSKLVSESATCETNRKYVLKKLTKSNRLLMFRNFRRLINWRIYW